MWSLYILIKHVKSIYFDKLLFQTNHIKLVLVPSLMFMDKTREQSHSLIKLGLGEKVFCKLSFCRTYSPLNLTTFVQPSTGQKFTPSISCKNAHICFIPLSLGSGELNLEDIFSRISLLKKRPIFYRVQCTIKGPRASARYISI